MLEVDVERGEVVDSKAVELGDVVFVARWSAGGGRSG